MLTIKQLNKRMEEIRKDPTPLAPSPEFVANDWVRNLFRLFVNIQTTSLRESDRDHRISELAIKLASNE